MNRVARLMMIAVALFALAAPGIANAQTQNGNNPNGVNAVGPYAVPPVIDTAATHALKRMGEYLRTLKAFQIEADVLTEEVLQDGLKAQLSNKVNLVAEKPNRLRVELSSDRKQRMFFFDGETFTLFAPRQTFYSVIPAPSTINGLATMLEEKYDVDLPLVDLFRWGTPEGDQDEITIAKDLGASTVNGITTEHYAFRQPGLDWQVWIQNGDFPLPLKLVLTTLTDEARPQHQATYTWNLAPSITEDAFEFTPPKDAKKIPMTEVAKMRKQNANNNGGTK
jgi:hypothetical protein